MQHVRELGSSTERSDRCVLFLQESPQHAFVYEMVPDCRTICRHFWRHLYRHQEWFQQWRELSGECFGSQERPLSSRCVGELTLACMAGREG